MSTQYEPARPPTPATEPQVLHVVPDPAPDGATSPAPEGAETVVLEGVVLDPDRDGSVLGAGDAVGGWDGPGTAVDGHLIQVAVPTRGSRLRDALSGERAQIVPGWVRDPQIVKETTTRAAQGVAHWVAYRVVHAPVDVAVWTWWGMRGTGARLLEAADWVRDADGHPVYGVAPATSASEQTIRERQHRTILLERLKIAGLALTVLAVAAFIGFAAAPPVARSAPVLVAVGWLVVVSAARRGRPVGASWVSPAVRREVRMPLTAAAVVSALATVSARLEKAMLPDAGAGMWRTPLVPRRGGYQAHLQLPLGFSAADLVAHEHRIAAALSRAHDCAVIEVLPHVTDRDLRLHVLDAPALSRPGRSTDVGPSPLMSTKTKADVFAGVVVGVDRLWTPVRLRMSEESWLIAGLQGSGKSVLLRAIEAAAALDHRGAMLSVIGLKPAVDHHPTRAVCHRYEVAEITPGQSLTDALAATAVRAVQVLREIDADLGRRAELLAKVGAEKVTRDIAHAHPGLRQHIVLIDEVHVLFDEETVGKEVRVEVERILNTILRLGRYLGITLVLATQRGNVDSLGTVVANVSRRVAFRVSGHVALTQILGTGASKEIDPSSYKSLVPGVCYTAGEDGALTRLQTYLITHAAFADLCARALERRTKADALSGDATGDVVRPGPAIDPTDLLRDVLKVLGTAAPQAWTDVAWLRADGGLEPALAGLRPDVYADRGDGWLAPALRERGVATEEINRRVTDEGTVRQRTLTGVRDTEVRRALGHLVAHTDPQP